MGSSSSSVSAPGEQDPGQLDAAALAAGQGAQRLVEDPVLDVEARADLPGLGLGGVAAAGVQRGVGLLVAAHPAVPDVRVVRAHLVLGLPQPAYDLVEAARGQDPVQREHLGVAGARVLRQVADAAGAGHRAGRGQRLAGQDLGERGLAGAVAADQPDLVAGGDPEGDVVHEQACARADLEMVGGDHGSGPRRAGDGTRTWSGSPDSVGGAPHEYQSTRVQCRHRTGRHVACATTPRPGSTGARWRTAAAAAAAAEAAASRWAAAAAASRSAAASAAWWS